MFVSKEKRTENLKILFQNDRINNSVTKGLK